MDEIFGVQTDPEFLNLALKVFRFQYASNRTYKQYCDLVGCKVDEVSTLEEIPFLPIQFFKTNRVRSFEGNPEITFSSSGTSGTVQSSHDVYDLSIYEQSFLRCFELFYGTPADFLVLGLLPSYLEREGSSLIYMADRLIALSKHPESGFYLDDHESLVKVIQENSEKKILLIGVSYALLDLAENHTPNLNGQLVMETGGMKGRRKEIPKEELHRILKKGFQLNNIHSEYGMTELLSQAYSKGEGVFQCPPWMKILSREYNDPFSFTRSTSGGINVIDLANVYSCSFIATEDLGKLEANGKDFRVLGRIDNSDVRGCNLMIE